MSEKKKPFSDPRWNDTSKPKVIGYQEISEAKYEKLSREHLKNRRFERLKHSRIREGAFFVGSG
ncbi:hypothetical protein [Cohnella cellulosilytica]|uniref:hypothetical protein n=1 Tax=Cohnella cellulosilytica TaxID=986710 RepID=UPI00361B6CD6